MKNTQQMSNTNILMCFVYKKPHRFKVSVNDTKAVCFCLYTLYTTYFDHYLFIQLNVKRTLYTIRCIGGVSPMRGRANSKLQRESERVLWSPKQKPVEQQKQMTRNVNEIENNIHEQCILRSIRSFRPNAAFLSLPIDGVNLTLFDRNRSYCQYKTILVHGVGEFLPAQVFVTLIKMLMGQPLARHTRTHTNTSIHPEGKFHYLPPR